MVLPEQTTNFIRKGRFINNDKMLSRFVAATDYQGALDYFGFEGTYRPKKGAGADYVKGTDYYGSTDPTTGNIYYGNFAFSSFDNLYSTYVKESYTQKNAINGTVAINEEYANDPNLRNMRYYPEEAKGFKYAFERTGLFYRTKINNFNQANAYWIGSYGEPLMTKWCILFIKFEKWVKKFSIVRSIICEYYEAPSQNKVN
jgi:hypothetical protein